MASFAFTSSNLNTLAMAKMAPIAGKASSIQGVLATIIAAIAGFVIGQSFDGTQLPFLWGLTICAVAGGMMVIITDPRRLFERMEPAITGEPLLAE